MKSRQLRPIVSYLLSTTEVSPPNIIRSHCSDVAIRARSPTRGIKSMGYPPSFLP
ncbi:hypothetical protein CY34DRAFT_806446 [Suillus luteus UH-Slu-Lm8-n1]|uniref:Uncharacterized protein n=1 Tax=Suillus luteus UH-Slu-Lm8-n1 TaxID=930992 RepID=A0A0C9ZT91_9AGAM|nr:hypothetical protein CY34DRAFT_806446 [Suillus luteus UH-Slu-Lm8-n1]